MCKINFKKFKMYTGIDRSNTVVVDTAKDFSNLLYTSSSGVMAHHLALSIYESDGPVTLTAEELAFLRAFCKGSTTPAFQDSLENNIEDGEL